ncbi:hypothetical protein M8C21_022150, partial [Ambrosia artemisiifolia]
NVEEERQTLDLYENNGLDLKQKVEKAGIIFDSCSPGQYTYQICPVCKGGQSKERSLSFHINQNENVAIWRCFNFECGWAGHVLADGVNKVKFSKKLSEETLRLEPLGDELINYFAERMISAEILQKNAVMQMVDDKNVIAFTYRWKGEIVNCKFRSITDRKFWQEARFKYLLDCNGYLDKASRIILATDGDGPGQALAEELSCRLGKERCWLVTWPKKDEVTCCKDANEVLVHLGPEALRHVVETAELYKVKNST